MPKSAALKSSVTQPQTAGDAATQYPDHPSASLMPNMTEEEFLALKADIKQHGLREPIQIFNGQVVDGRHRLRACRELGIEPRVEERTCREQDLPGWVHSLNVYRRHLSREQKQALIRQKLKETPDKSDRQIAKDLGWITKRYLRSVASCNQLGKFPSSTRP